MGCISLPCPSGVQWFEGDVHRDQRDPGEFNTHLQCKIFNTCSALLMWLHTHKKYCIFGFSFGKKRGMEIWT